MDNKYIYVLNVYSVGDTLLKESIITVKSYRKYILFLVVQDAFKTAEIKSVIFVHIIFRGFSIISGYFPVLTKVTDFCDQEQ